MLCAKIVKVIQVETETGYHYFTKGGKCISNPSLNMVPPTTDRERATALSLLSRPPQSNLVDAMNEITQKLRINQPR